MDTEALPISPYRLLETLASAQAPLVVDVRRRPNFETDPQFVAGATWRDPFALDDWTKLLPRHRAVVAYCVHGHEISRNACSALRASGIDARYLEFDALVEDFAIRDDALGRLATIVRAADTGRPELAPESAGLLAISHGLGQLFGDDHELLEREFVIYDALYAACRGGGAGPGSA